MTYGLLAALAAVWLLVQGAGLEPQRLIATTCNYGLVPGEVTHAAAVGVAVPMGSGLACVVDREPVNWLTPITSLFLHGSWGHLMGNALFLVVFGRSVEDGMGRLRYFLFYLLCGIAGGAAQVAIDPASPVPIVGASGAISGVLGGYLALYPMARIRVLFIWVVFVQQLQVRAVFILLWWVGLQLLAGLPQLAAGQSGSGGVAFWAHIGGFALGALMVRLISRDDLLMRHRQLSAKRARRAR